MSVRHVNTLVLIAACITGALVVGLGLIVTFYYRGWLSLATFQMVSGAWGAICLAYLIIQSLPLWFVFSINDHNFKVDKYTSWMVLVLAVVLTAAYYSQTERIVGMPILLIETFLTGVLEVSIVWMSAHVREQYRSATAARVAALEADRNWNVNRVTQLERAFPGAPAAVPAPPGPRPACP